MITPSSRFLGGGAKDLSATVTVPWAATLARDTTLFVTKPICEDTREVGVVTCWALVQSRRASFTPHGVLYHLRGCPSTKSGREHTIIQFPRVPTSFEKPLIDFPCVLISDGRQYTLLWLFRS